MSTAYLENAAPINRAARLARGSGCDAASIAAYDGADERRPAAVAARTQPRARRGARDRAVRAEPRAPVRARRRDADRAQPGGGRGPAARRVVPRSRDDLGHPG